MTAAQGARRSLEESKRAVQEAAHAAADQQADRLAALASSYLVVATVTAVVAAGAADGITALVKVTWRNGQTTAAGWNASQTFAVGQRVVCAVIENQLFVDFPVVGQP